MEMKLKYKVGAEVTLNAVTYSEAKIVEILNDEYCRILFDGPVLVQKKDIDCRLWEK